MLCRTTLRIPASRNLPNRKSPQETKPVKRGTKPGKTAFVPAQAPHVRPTVQRTLLRNLRFSTFGSPSRPVVLCRNADFLPRGFVHNL